jgi:hypothetical protein
MLRRQIIKALGKQIDIDDLAYAKYAIISFRSIACMLISVIVTINRTVPIQRCQSSSSHCIMRMTTNQGAASKL